MACSGCCGTWLQHKPLLLCSHHGRDKQGVGTRTAPAASWGDPMPTASGWIAQMYPVHVVHRGLDLRPGKPLQPGSSSRKAVTLNTAFVGPRAGTGSNLPLGLASTQAGRGAAGYTC